MSMVTCEFSVHLDSPFAHNNDSVRVQDGAESVGNDEHGVFFQTFFDCLLN